MKGIKDIRKPIEQQFAEYEQLFRSYFLTDNPLLQSVFSLLNARLGKQIRPTLTLLSAQLCRQINQKTLMSAAALEIMHTATLLHDDVVDDSPMRRGLPSVKAQWSNKVAILAGDYMLAKVIEIIAALRNVRILNIVSDIGKALSSGELMQLPAEKSMWIDEQQYFNIIGCKTARLFQACCEAGAVSAAATAKQEAALALYGEQLGLCFQMQDDLLDYSDSEELGKPLMHDALDGKATLPLIVSLRRAPMQEAEHIKDIVERLIQDIERNPQQVLTVEQELKAFVLRFDGIRYTKQQIEQHRQIAMQALDCFAENEIKQSLADLLTYAICRVK